MRTIACFLFLLVSLNCIAQRSEVMVDSVRTKAELYSKTLLWIAKTWKSANDVVQLKDEGSGVIVVHGGLQAKPATMGVAADGTTITGITFTIKEGKMKLQFENTRFEYTTGVTWTYTEKPSMSGKAYDKWKAAVDAEIETMIADLKRMLAEKSDF